MFYFFNHPLDYLIIGHDDRLVQPAEAEGGNRCFLVFTPTDRTPLPGNNQVFCFSSPFSPPLALNLFQRKPP